MLSLPSSVQATMAAAGDALVQIVLARGGGGAVAPFDEPTAVAAVVLGGMPMLAHAWAPSLSALGLTATFTGVFCHSSPQVRFTGAHGASRVELADLLLVVDMFSSNRAVDRRAHLVQAKIAAGGSIRIGGSGQDAKQLDLLENWPSFDFVSKAFPGARDFRAAGQPGAWPDSGGYGGLDLSSRTWWQSAPSPLMSGLGAPGLAASIVGMLTGAAGREASLSPSDDWSRTIIDLMNVTGARAFRQGGGGGQRGVTALMNLGAGLAHGPNVVSRVFRVGEPPPDAPGSDVERGDGPISVIRIAVSGRGE